MTKQKWSFVLAIIALFITISPIGLSTAKAEDSRTFPETGHTVKGLFLTYWETHGGLAQQGYPISEELQEQSDTDGKTYTMQYFERAVFEMHPENQPPFDVLLSLLGVFYYNEKYNGNAPNQQASTDNPRTFSETGKTIGGVFRSYWETHGGLAQQGYPISDEFSEVSQTDGKTYTVQYFERAVFENHPEFANTPNEVLLSLLGVFYYNKKHGGTPQPTVVANPTATEAATATPIPQPVGPTGQVLFLNGGGVGQPALIDQQGNIFNQQAFDLGSQDWTHFTSSGGYLLVYKQSGGAETAKLDADGSYLHEFSYVFRAGHTNLTTAGNLVVLFERSTKVLDPGRINPDGTFQPVSTKNLGVPYADVIGSVSGRIFFYLNNPDVDEFEHYMTAKIDDSTGNLTDMVPVTLRIRVGADRNWKAIAFVDDTHIFFYNPITGQYDVREVKTDGTLADGAPRSFDLGWTGFAVMPIGGRFLGARPLLLTYRLDTGAAATWAFDTSYNLGPLQTFQGPNALAPGWTMLSALR